jgi:hypothetical protein
MAIDKLVQYDSRPDATGEALVHPASGSLDKTASEVHADVRSYLDQAPSPGDGVMRLLITALSSFDRIGPNKNGDGFYREDLLGNVDYGTPPEGDGSLEIPMYKSFEHFARPYKHHINRDDSPAYGTVEKSFFNPKMDRVELVAHLDADKAPMIAQKIRNYEPVSTSMGFRAALDVCSVCGNKASSRAEYCDHLRKNMLEVKPNGHIVHARNPKGKFFDISFVEDRADPTSRAVATSRLPVGDGTEINNPATGDLENGGVSARGENKEAFAKAASTGQDEVRLSADAAEEAGLGGEKPLRWRKSASEAHASEAPASEDEEGKTSYIKKRVRADVEELPEETEERIKEAVRALRENETLIPAETLESVAGYPMESVASTAAAAGISLRPVELQHVALTKAGAPELARRLRKTGSVLSPENKKGGGLEVGPPHVNGRLYEKIASNEDLMDKRSYHPLHLSRRLEKSGALGPNPYVRNRQEITPGRAAAMASPEERRRIRMNRNRRAREEVERASVLEAIANVLAEGQWVEGRMPRHQRQTIRQDVRRRRPRRQLAARRARRSNRRRPRDAGMMTLPVTQFIRGTGGNTQVYGPAESAMQKESALRKQASRRMRRIAESMGGLSKVASQQVDWVLEEPTRHDAPDVNAALIESALRRT